MKTCTKCNESRDLTAFSKKGNGLASICKTCHAQYLREVHYPKNRKAYIERANQHNKSKMLTARKWVNAIKAQPCTDCGQCYPPYVMQFDHLHSKSFNVSRAVGMVTDKKLKAEIAKCELVCANCHAERTYRRRAIFST